MKKILIGTSALVAAGFMVANDAAAAEAIKLNVGGRMAQLIGYAKNDEVARTFERAKFDVKGVSEVYFTGSTKLDNGLTVAVRFELEGDNQNTTTMDESFLTVSSDQFGKVTLGADKHIGDNVAFVAPAAGQPWRADEVNVYNWVETPANGNFVIQDGSLEGSDAYKIGYQTPAFFGLSAFASFAPDDTEGTGLNGDQSNKVAGERSGANYGLVYNGEFGGVTLGASYGYYHTSNDTNQHRAGVNVGFAGFTVGGEYAKIDEDSTAPTSSTVANSDNTGYYYDLGVSYATGPYTVALSYLKGVAEGVTPSDAKNDTSKLYNLGVNYTMGPGVTLLGNLFRADFTGETTGVGQSNDAWGVSTGLALSF